MAAPLWGSTRALRRWKQENDARIAREAAEAAEAHAAVHASSEGALRDLGSALNAAEDMERSD